MARDPDQSRIRWPPPSRLAPSEPGDEARPGLNGPALRKLSSNESPSAPPESVLDALRGALSEVRQYPSPDGAEVTEALTHLLARTESFAGLDSSQVLCGNGSVAPLRSTFAWYVGVGDPVVTSWRSLEAYPLFATWYGAGSHHDQLDRVFLRTAATWTRSLSGWPRTIARLCC